MNTRLLAVLGGFFLLAGETFAQAVLEEVTVTARKRAESLVDVPVSISVTSGEKLEQLSLRGLEDLSGFTPNLQVNENATQQTVTIRGVGSGANQAFEQSVGTYVDGVYFGRGRSARNLFFDMERVEIIRGPQGLLFGKNTIAGAVNVTTRRPTEELEAYLEGEYFGGTGQAGVTAVVSGPLADNVRARLAGHYKSEEGYVRNTFTGEREAAREEFIIRAVGVWEIGDSLDFTFKGEISSYDVDGRTAQNVQAGPLAAVYPTFDPRFETNLDFYSSTPGDDFDNTDTGNLTLRANWAMDDELTITYISGYTAYDFANNIPAEFTPVPDYAEQSNRQDHWQISQELRTHYVAADGRLEFLGGVYFAYEDLDIEETFNFNLPALRAVGGAAPPLDASVITFFSQDTESYAVFGEAQFSPMEQLRLSAGVRYTYDAKDMDKELLVAARGTQTRAPEQEGFAAAIGRIPHQHNLERSDKRLTPAVGVQFDVTDYAMLYGSWSRGFKAGGFDAQNSGGNLDLAAYDSEKADSFEAGAKFDFLDGAARLSLNYFYTDFNDLQVSAWNGLVFTVANAASATSMGVEADGSWQVTENFNVGGSAAWLHAEYDDFPNATCTAPQQIAFAARTGLPAGRCAENDLSSRDLQFSPKMAGNVNASLLLPLLDAFRVTLQGDLNFTTSYHTALDLDPVAKQGGFVKLNMRLELASLNERLSVAVVGKNLTDRKTTTWVNDMPVLRGAYFGFVDPPRSVGVQVRVSM